MKKFFLGFIIGALMFALLPAGAAIQEYICYKVDYKVMINGLEYTDPELPVLNYKGHTYAPFRSILSAAGLDIYWNSELKQAEVTQKESEGNTMNITVDSLKIYTIDGVEYIRGKDIYDKYNYSLQLVTTTSGDKIFNFVNKDGKIIIENVPIIVYQGISYIETAYYLNIILPLINE